MTRTTNARIAGLTYLVYIALAYRQWSCSTGPATPGTAARIARIAQHASDVRIVLVLTLLTCFAALLLAVSLYGITRDEDRDLAMLALSCRVGEGVLNAMGPMATLGLLWLGRP